MEGEMYRTFKVWLTVFISLCYCYALGKITPKGTTRLLCVLPIVGLFLLLPLNLYSIHIGGTTAFFIAWLANFKLLLFAFDKGPLCADSSISLARFVAIGCLPIKVQQNYPPPKSHLNGKNKENPPPNSHTNGRNKENPVPQKPREGHKSPLNYAMKCILLAILLRIYDYSDYIHPKILLFLYSFHIYFCLEIILAVFGALARALLQLELEPQFDEPYLSTSLQDFWGRRWNLMVTGILRPTVYEPILSVTSRVMGRRWASLPAVLGTFVVSALMHELIFYYLGRVRSTWEITWFFLLHGVCLMVEIVLKKVLVTGKWRLPRLVSVPFTVTFVMSTGFWLFFPQLLQCKADVRAFEEYAAVAAFLKSVGRALTLGSFNASSG